MIFWMAVRNWPIFVQRHKKVSKMWLVLGKNKLEFIHFNLDIHYWFSGIASSIDGIAEQFRQLGPNGGNSVHY
jgi:hypothetical protein